jgi:hypothetical protein
MTRGNQRDKAREKNLKEQSAAVRAPRTSLHTHYTWLEVGREGRRRQTLLSNGPAYPVSCVLCQGQRADVIRSAEEEKHALRHRVSEGERSAGCDYEAETGSW